jgi:hypothetical protein
METNKNTYSKYCPNVFVAKCEQKHESDEIIILRTKYGKEHENIVHNYLGKSRDGEYLYSITRADGFNHQERARRKSEKLSGYASNAESRSQNYYEASKENAEFLALGEPIKIGHHSERRHRKLIERNWSRLGKSVKEKEKAQDYINRAEYWKNKVNDINLSQPESLSYFEFKLEEARKAHKFLKDNPEERAHSYSLTYANKNVKELTKKVETAIKLWGDPDDIEQLNKEKEEQAKKKALKGSKGKRLTKLIDDLGGFFFFGSDSEQFKQRYNELLKAGKVEEGETVSHLKAGLYVPTKNVKQFINSL